MRVDLKSMFLGTILTLVLFVILGQTNKPNQPMEKYSITSADGLILLLNTQTGVTWSLKTKPYLFWTFPIPKEDDFTLEQLIEHRKNLDSLEKTQKR